MRKMIACSVLALFVSAATAQEFVAVNISPSPDEIVKFDVETPGDSTFVQTVPANFIRGLEMDSETTGWFVASSSISGSPTGFYRIEDGGATQIAPIPFDNNSGSGGMTFGPGNQFLYYALNDGDTNSLWQIDFAGNFTLIGQVSSTVDTDIDINGLAFDESTGSLFALDAQADALMRVDLETLEATPVGNLGLSVSAIGGMDFALDDSGLFAASTFGDFYRIDPVTGQGTLLGDLGFNTSAIAAIPEPASIVLLGLAGLALLRRR